MPQGFIPTNGRPNWTTKKFSPTDDVTLLKKCPQGFIPTNGRLKWTKKTF